VSGRELDLASWQGLNRLVMGSRDRFSVSKLRGYDKITCLTLEVEFSVALCRLCRMGSVDTGFASSSNGNCRPRSAQFILITHQAPTLFAAYYRNV